MADVAQLVRALVCGTRCRRFESDLPPHSLKRPFGRFSLLYKEGVARSIPPTYRSSDFNKILAR